MTKRKLGRGAQPGHPGWGGRPRGVEMPCGWCGEPFTQAELKVHFTDCKKRPKPKPTIIIRTPAVSMLCGWGCCTELRASDIRKHFTICPKRPKPPNVP